MANKSYKVRNKESEGKSNQKAYAMKKLKRQDAAPKILSEMQPKNLQAYLRMNLNQEYDFALCYVFEKYPNHRALYLDTTDMSTQRHMIDA
jgi:hypothetical protein